MSLWIDGFAHDIFPNVQNFQAFAFRDRPVLKLLESRKHEGVGKTYGYPVLAQAAISQGTTRAAVQQQQAVNAANGADVEEFVLGYFKPGYKGGFILDDFNMAITEGSGGVPSGAYIDEFTLQMQECSSEFGQRQELYFIGRSGRSLARSTANQGTTTLATGIITLTDRFQLANIRKGQLLQFAIVDGSDGGHALLTVAGGNLYEVSAVNFDTGVCTIVATTGGGTLGALNTAASTNQVFIFNNSDFQGNSATLLPPGFQEWVTSSAPTGTFQSVDRTNDSRLGGFRVTADPGRQLDSVIDKGLEEARSLYGASGEYTILLSSRRWTQLMKLGENRGYRLLDGKTVLGGYEYLEYRHGMMKAKIIDVPVMSSDDIFFCKMDGWTVRHAGGWPRMLPGDGLKVLRQGDNDNYEYRNASYYHYGCKNINHQGRSDISGLSV